MMVGMECIFAVGGGRFSFPEIFRPSFEYCDATNGAAHRSAHAVPSDRGTGMEDHFLIEAVDDIAGALHIDEDRLSL